MIQVILNPGDAGFALPETSHDKYSCWEEELSVQVDMISGRRVIEARGKVWKCSWSYDYMGNDQLRQLLALLRSSAPIVASVLTDSGNERLTTTFVVESMTQPTFAFSRNDVGLWHNVGFVLREEKPH